MEGDHEVEGLHLRNYIQSRFRTRPEDWFRWQFSQFRFPPGARILEIGGGTGELWVRNLKAISPSWQIYISDLSQEMMDTAREKLQKLLPPPACTVCDAQRLPFAGATFHAVIADGVLDQVNNVDRTLTEIEQILARGGCLYASTGGEDHLKELREMVNVVAGQAPYGRSSDQFTIENGARLLGARFPNVERKDYVDRLVFQEAQPIIVYALSESSMASTLTGECLVRFSQLVEQRLAERERIEIISQKGLFRACKT